MATDIAVSGAVRKSPRISINKLGEYMTATPLRRRRIVADQKRPKAFVVPRYREAQVAITKYLIAGANDATIVLAEIERLGLAPSATEWEEQRKELCAEALERFLEMAADIDLKGSAAIAANNDQPRLTMGGLEVSVRPEVQLLGEDCSAGAVKLYLSKTIPLNAEGGQYVATAVHQFVDCHLAPGQTDPRKCLVVDVFGGQVFSAPRALARRRRDLEAACEEIARTWEAV